MHRAADAAHVPYVEHHVEVLDVDAGDRFGAYERSDQHQGLEYQAVLARNMLDALRDRQVAVELEQPVDLLLYLSVAVMAASCADGVGALR